MQKFGMRKYMAWTREKGQKTSEEKKKKDQFEKLVILLFLNEYHKFSFGMFRTK